MPRTTPSEGSCSMPCARAACARSWMRATARSDRSRSARNPLRDRDRSAANASADGGPPMTGPARTSALLAVADVVKRFGGVAALDGCTLEVAPGTITGLIGPNGAGKTTLFNTITGLIAPDAGEIRLGPHRLDGRPSHAIARLGVGRTFQIPRPLGRMTVLENLLVYAKARRGESLTAVF